MIGPRNCALTACASSFPYKDECGLVASGCCARDMLASIDRLGANGAKFPMDLRPGGNPFVNAMVGQELILVRHDVARRMTPAPSDSLHTGEEE